MPSGPPRTPELTATAATWRDAAARERRLPPGLVDELTRLGCFRMLVPKSHGGHEVAIPELLRLVSDLSRADGAIGWSVGQAALAQVIFAYLPVGTFDALYADGPDVLGAGAIAPKGRALRAGGGDWRVSGQWPFVTGCQHATWFYGQCVVVDGGPLEPGRPAPGGAASTLPELRLVLLPMGEVTIVDSWHVLGLQGSGSHDVKVRRRGCPDERTCAIVGQTPTVDRPIFRVPLVEYGALLVAAVLAGIARGAVDDILALAATGKRSAFSPHQLADDPLFQDRVGEAYLSARAAQALLMDQAAVAWARVDDGEPLSATERAALRATAAEVAELASRGVDLAYWLGGGTSIYDSCALQRRLRDLRTAAQHAVASRQSFLVLGSVLAGRPELHMR